MYFRPLRALTYVVLPYEIQAKHAVINIKNNDSKCFLWTVIAGILFKLIKLKQ